MKINQWTLGLAAVGVVSLASAVNAEEKMNALQTALSATTISGYVDTSVEWSDNDYTGGSFPLTIPFRGRLTTGHNSRTFDQLAVEERDRVVNSDRNDLVSRKRN